jgi:bacillithiol system protein YtxJ
MLARFTRTDGYVVIKVLDTKCCCISLELTLKIDFNMFKKLFGISSSAKASEDKKEKLLPWIALNSIDQLDVIAELSKTKTQLIFKHSTRCGISLMVMNQFVAAYDLDLNADLYYLDLLRYREVSNEVGYKFQVLHESPQLLVIKNGVVVAHASHGAINDIDLAKFV